MKQKGDDYKISAVKYYLNNNDTMDNTCKIFNCKKPSLHRWIQIYKTKKNLQRKQMKYKEPTLGKGMRTLFRKNNYKVYLVDEFRSSCKCSNCEGGVCEKFRVRQHPNKKKDELRLVHGLLRCKSGCGLWNRDRNGSSNIYKIAEKAINKLERPSYLCRESNQALKPSCYNQTLQGYEKTQP